MPRKCDGCVGFARIGWVLKGGTCLRIEIPSSFPSESMILFVFSTWHLLFALLVSRTGVMQRAADEERRLAAAMEVSAELPEAV